MGGLYYNIQRGLTGTGRGGLHPIQLSAMKRQMDALHWRGKKTKQTEYILPRKYEHDVSISSLCISVSLCIPTQTVYTLALQRPLSGQAGLLGLAPGKPGSTVVPISGLAAPKPCMNDKSLIIWACEVRQTYINII